MYKEILLTNGFKTKVDEEDYKELSRHKWYFKNGYVYKTSNHKNKEQLYMHRIILNTPKGMSTDHINSDRLDNRKSNLRVCTHKENLRNIKSNKNNKSGFKGVRQIIGSKKYAARIVVNKKHIHLGVFDDSILAAKEYDKAAIKYFGEFARTNFPKEEYV